MPTTEYRIHGLLAETPVRTTDVAVAAAYADTHWVTAVTHGNDTEPVP